MVRTLACVVSCVARTLFPRLVSDQRFQDEADILGDRICIMSAGRLRCAGSSLFLKKTYGVGYQLTIEKQNSSPDASGDTVLMDIVENSVHDATMLTNVGSELSYQLPMGAASSFGPMFDGLDAQVDKGNVGSYGVSITTLDEVFLLVAKGETKDAGEGYSSSKRLSVASSRNLDDDVKQGNAHAEPVGDASMSKSARSRMDLESSGLFVRHVGALFKKRAAFFRRDKKAWLCTTFIPSLFVLAGFLVFKLVPVERNLDPVTLDLSSYNVRSDPQNPVFFNSPDDSFQCQPGSCAYGLREGIDLSFAEFDDAVTEEKYSYCGARVALGSEVACSISESESIMNMLSDGAVGEASLVTTVLEASDGVAASAKQYRYVVVRFTLQRYSVLPEDTPRRRTNAGELCTNLSCTFILTLPATEPLSMAASCLLTIAPAISTMVATRRTTVLSTSSALLMRHRSRLTVKPTRESVS